MGSIIYLIHNKMISEQKTIMERVSFVPSMLCNLNCRLCGARSPYKKNSKPTPIEKLISTAERYFKIVDQIKIFSISGGEPLLYKELPIFISNLYQYKDQIGKFNIYTNGTTIPSDELIKSVKMFPGAYFVIDNYGPSLSRKIEKISSVLTESNVEFYIRDYCSDEMHCGGWVDYGDPSVCKYSIDHARNVFKKCAAPQILKFCFTVYNGIMTPCSIIDNRIFMGLDVNPVEYIDLFDNTLSIDEQKRKINNIYNMSVLPSCVYCNGMCDDSPRYKPAEQIPYEEQKKLNVSS